MMDELSADYELPGMWESADLSGGWADTEDARTADDVAMDDLPIVPMKGSEGWARAYDWGRKLDARFPEQDAEDFAYACEYNDPGPAENLAITGFVCEQFGERDLDNWVWRVTFEDGSTWVAEGGCDYTGWDCRSSLEWRHSDGSLHPAACGPGCRSQHTDDHSRCTLNDGRDGA